MAQSRDNHVTIKYRNNVGGGYDYDGDDGDEEGGQNDNSQNKVEEDIPGLQQLTMAELRSRLAALDIDTATPGQSGDNRREELMRRLVQAICGGDKFSADSHLDEMLESGSLLHASVVTKGRAPPEPEPPSLTINIPSIDEAKLDPPIEFSDDSDDEREREEEDERQRQSRATVAAMNVQGHVQLQQQRQEGMSTLDSSADMSVTEVNETKREIKRISNKRALMTASRLAGSSQDEMLRLSEKSLSRAEAELARVKSIKPKSANDKVSSILIDNGSMMLLESLRCKLETLKTETRDEIKNHRLRIRQEEEGHIEYGVGQEEKLNQKLQAAIFKKGRERRLGEEKRAQNLKNRFESPKMEEVKGMDLPDESIVNVKNMNKEGDTMTTMTGKRDVDNEDDQNENNFDIEREIEKEREIQRALRRERERAGAIPMKVRPVSAQNNPFDENGETEDEATQLKQAAQFLMSQAEEMISPKKVAKHKIPPPLSDHGNKVEKIENKKDDDHKLEKYDDNSDTSNRDGNGEESAGESMNPLGVKKTNQLQREDIDRLIREFKEDLSTIPTTFDDDDIDKTFDIKSRPTTAGIRSSRASSAVNTARDAVPPDYVDDDDDDDGGSDGGDHRSSGNHMHYSRPLTPAAVAYKSIAAMEDQDDTDDDENANSEDDEGHDAAWNAFKRMEEGKNKINAKQSDEVADVVSARINHGEGEDNYKVRKKTTREDETPIMNRKEDIKERHNISSIQNKDVQRTGQDLDISSTVNVRKETVKSYKKASTHVIEQMSQAVDHKMFGIDSDDDDYGDEESIAIAMARERAAKKAQAESAMRSHKPKTLRPPPPTTPPARAIANSKINKVLDANVNIEEFFDSSPSSRPNSSKNKSAPGENGFKDDNNHHIVDKNERSTDDENESERDEIDECNYHTQIRELLKHASVLEGHNELEKAESLYEKALLLGPTDLKVLDSFAVFLHKKKGEISRAESFFRRAVQVYAPQLMMDLKIGVSKGARPPLESPIQSPNSASSSPIAKSPMDPWEEKGSRTSVASVIRLLLNYAAFINRGKGDVEGAFIIYRRAYRIDATNAKVLAHFAHFLAEEGGDFINSPSKNATNERNRSFTTLEAERLFSLALKSNPGDPLIALWYAKLLKKDRKFGQSELMYKVAYESCISLRKLREKHAIDLPDGAVMHNYTRSKSARVEAAAICNYATFIHRVRKDVDRAKLLFVDGITRFPTHKGMIKSISSFLKHCKHSLDEKDMMAFSRFIETDETRC